MRSSLLCMLCKSVDFKGLTAFKSSPLMNTDFTDLNKAKKHLPRISADARGLTLISATRDGASGFVAVSFTFCVLLCSFVPLVVRGWFSSVLLCDLCG
jgi:hypothetical protein